MKKLCQKWTTLLVVVFLSFGFAACSDSSSSDEGGVNGTSEEVMGALAGTWRMEKVTAHMMGMDAEIPGEQLRQTAASSGYRIWDDILVFNNNKMNGVPFKLNGSEILLESEPNVYGIRGMKITIKTLTETKLVLKEDLSEFLSENSGTSIDYVCDVEYSRN